jgi:hypothetical protein
MSDPGERRGAARFITILPLNILDAKGAVLDGRATAHDLTTGGFKAECQHDVEEGRQFHFSLELPDGKPPARGKAKAVWVKKHDFAVWIGGQIVSMDWSDRRRLRAVLAPPSADWGRVADHALRLLGWLVVALAVHRVAFEGRMRRTAVELIPTFVALLVMAWALLSFVRRR